MAAAQPTVPGLHDKTLVAWVAPAELTGGLDPSKGTTATVAEQIANAQSTGDWARAGSLKAMQLFELRNGQR